MSGFVYFITMEPDEYVKIGYTSYNPYSRLNAMQTGCPQALHLRAMFHGTMEDERALHEFLEDHRYRGEWFVVDGALDTLMQAISCHDPKPMDRDQFINLLHAIFIPPVGWETHIVPISATGTVQ